MILSENKTIKNVLVLGNGSISMNEKLFSSLVKDIELDSVQLQGALDVLKTGLGCFRDTYVVEMHVKNSNLRKLEETILSFTVTINKDVLSNLIAARLSANEQFLTLFKELGDTRGAT